MKKRGGPGPLNLKFCSMSILLTATNFFKSISLHKNWRGRGGIVIERYTIDG